MVDLCVLGYFEVLHDGACSHNSALNMLYTEAFKCFCSEVFEQFLTCRLFGKHPVVHFKNAMFGAEILLEFLFMTAFVQHFFGRKVTQQLLNIVECTLCSKKFAGRNIEKRHAAGHLSKVNSSEKVVFFIV